MELIVTRLQSLAQHTRVKIIDRLEQREHSVQELSDELGVAQQNISKHLGCLVEAGMLRRRTEGRQAFYSVGRPGLITILESLAAP